MRSIYYSRYIYDLKALTSHEEESFSIIIDLVKQSNTELIVELGSGYYGMTLLFHECNKKINIVTYDRYPGIIYASRALGIVTKQEIYNVVRFGLNHDRITLIIADVIIRKNKHLCLLLNMPIKKILYCDNGKKDREVNYYGPELNSGDILGVHDWKTEIKPEKVADTLNLFEPLSINKTFKEKGLLTRFFIKK